MPDTLGKIPIDWIVEDLKGGHIIPFLGAGASAFPQTEIAKPPSAAILAEELARQGRHPQYLEYLEYLEATKLDPSPDPALAERLFQARQYCTNLALIASWIEFVGGDRSRLGEILRRLLTDRAAPLPSNDLHNLLARVAKAQPMAIITTNYDDLMEMSLRTHGVPFDLCVVVIEQKMDKSTPPGVITFRGAEEDRLRPVTAEETLLDIVIAKDDRRGSRLNRTVVFKLHGHIDRDRIEDDTFVITEDDYITFLGRMGQHGSLIPADLANLMCSRRMLFLGYGLRDWNLRVLFDRIRSGVNRDTSIAIAKGIASGERELWQRRNVNVYDADLGAFVQALEGKLGFAP